MPQAFIPQIWSARFTSELREALQYKNMVNRNYEGEISSAGDTVKIPTDTTTIAMADYTENTDMAAPTTATGTTQDLVVNQQKSFHFYVDDITALQSKPDVMSSVMSKAAYSAAQVADNFLRDTFETAAKAGTGAQIEEISTALSAHNETTGASNSIRLYNLIVQSLLKAHRVMDRKYLPRTGRWVTVSPEVMEVLTSAFVNAQLGAAGQKLDQLPEIASMAFKNGMFTSMVGFDVNVVTNQTDQASDSDIEHLCIIGQGNEAVTYAEQIVKIESYRPELRIGDAVKGLYVYGAKAVHSDRLWNIKVNDTRS